MVHHKTTNQIKNQYISAILNFQVGRRPLEYYTTPINDFAEHKEIIVYIDDKLLLQKLSNNVTKIYVDYDDISNFKFESSWRSLFLKHFNDILWYNLSRTYLLKPKLIKITKDKIKADRYTWIDAGMPCSHLFDHNYCGYHNVYNSQSIRFIEDISNNYNFLTQGYISNIINGVNVETIYNLLNLLPNGKEHVSGCMMSMNNLDVDEFCDEFYKTLNIFHDSNIMGTDEAVCAITILKHGNYKMFPYSDFCKKLIS